MLFETLFLVNFCLIFEKIDDEKHMEFCLFFNRLFCHLFVQFDAFLYVRNPQKYRFFLGKMHTFAKMHFSRFMLKAIENESKDKGLGRRKGRKNQ